VFDVDGCLIDSLTGTSLRPGAAQLLAALHADGLEIRLWSAGGAVYARQKATAHGIQRFFSSFHDKEGRDDNGRYVTDGVLSGTGPVVFVDDHPEDLPHGADVLAVSSYIYTDRHDRGLARVAARAGVDLASD
jgi:long-chain acyl-CoA synthetase